MDPFWVKELSCNEVDFHYKEKWLTGKLIVLREKDLCVYSEL